MSSLHFTFGEQIQTGELARSPSATDETSLEIAYTLGKPPGPWPPFAVLPVLLDGALLGHINKICFVHGHTIYEFRSCSGNTVFSCTTIDATLQRLQEVLVFTSPPQGGT